MPKFFLSIIESLYFYRASATPDTIISSSSPEPELMQIKEEKYPALKPIITEEERHLIRRDSVTPDFPVICPIPVKGKFLTSRTLCIHVHYFLTFNHLRLYILI